MAATIFKAGGLAAVVCGGAFALLQANAGLSGTLAAAQPVGPQWPDFGPAGDPAPAAEPGGELFFPDADWQVEPVADDADFGSGEDFGAADFGDEPAFDDEPGFRGRAGVGFGPGTGVGFGTRAVGFDPAAHAPSPPKRPAGSVRRLAGRADRARRRRTICRP